MSDPVKAAAVLGLAIVASVAAWIYFSPYQTCVRAENARIQNAQAEIRYAWVQHNATSTKNTQQHDH